MKLGTWGGLPNTARASLPWEVSAAPSGCTWNSDLWDFPSATLKSGGTDPKLYYICLHLYPDGLLFQIMSPCFLFLTFFYLVPSAPANHTLHTARPSQQVQPITRQALLLPEHRKTSVRAS